MRIQKNRISHSNTTKLIDFSLLSNLFAYGYKITHFILEEISTMIVIKKTVEIQSIFSFFMFVLILPYNPSNSLYEFF